MSEVTTATDPVCGMDVDTATAEYRSFRNGNAYYFCSAGCKSKFDKDSGQFVHTTSTGGHEGQ